MSWFMNVLSNIGLGLIVFLISINNCFSAEKGLGQAILFVRDNNVWIYDIPSQKEHLLIKNSNNPSCSPDGRQVAFTRDYNIWVASLRDKKDIKATNFDPLSKNAIDNLSWSLANGYITFVRDQPYTIESGENKNSVAWPDGEVVAKKQNILLKTIWLTKTNGSKKIFIGFTGYGSGTVGTQLSQVQVPSWSPDGKKLAFSRNGDLWIAKVESLEDKIEERLMPVAYLENMNSASSSSRGVSGISWSMDGTKLVFSISRLYGSGVGELWWLDLKSKNLKKISSQGFEQSPVFLNQNVIVYSDGYNLREIDIDGRNDHEIVHDGTAPCSCANIK